MSEAEPRTAEIVSVDRPELVGVFRREILLDIGSWLRSGTGNCLMIVGHPGQGKTTLTHQVTMLAKKSDLSDEARYGVPHGGVEGVIDAQSCTVGEVDQAVKHLLGISGHAGTDQFLQQVVAALGPTIVVDGIDETVDGEWLSIALRLHRYIRAGGRLVFTANTATAGLLQQILIPDHVVDLDSATFTSGNYRDIASSVQDVVPAGGKTQHVEDFSKLVSLRSNGNFLAARLLVSAWARRGGDIQTWRAEQGLGDDIDCSTLESLIECDMNALEGRIRDTVVGMLASLAWAEGAGLPGRLWPVFTEAVTGRSCSSVDVTAVFGQSRLYVRESRRDTGRYFLLRHRVFTSYFRQVARDEY